jgi:hypothetical protein
LLLGGHAHLSDFNTELRPRLRLRQVCEAREDGYLPQPHNSTNNPEN